MLSANKHIDRVKFLMNNILYTTKVDSNVAYELRALIRADESIVYHIPQHTPLWRVVGALPNVKKGDSTVGLVGYSVYSKEMQRISREVDIDSRRLPMMMKNFVLKIMNDTVTMTDVQNTTDMLVHYIQEKEEAVMDVIELSTDFIKNHYKYTISQGGYIEVLMDMMAEEIQLFMKGARHEQIMRYSMGIIELFSKHIDVYSMMLLHTFRTLHGKTDLVHLIDHIDQSTDSIDPDIGFTFTRIDTLKRSNVFVNALDRSVTENLNVIREGLLASEDLGGLYTHTLNTTSPRLNTNNVKPTDVTMPRTGIELGYIFENWIHPKSINMIGQVTNLTYIDEIVLSKTLSKQYNFIVGYDILDNKLIFGIDNEKLVLFSKDKGKKSSDVINAIGVVNFKNSEIEEGLHNVNEVMDGMYSIVPYTILMKKEDPVLLGEGDSPITEGIRFDSDGSIHFVRTKNQSLVDEYMESKRLINTYIKHGSNESIKKEMVNLFGLIMYIESKYIGKKPLFGGKKKREDAMKARMFAISTFNQAYSYIIDTEPDFDFSQYLVSNQTEKVNHTLKYSELQGIKTIIQGIILS